MGRIIDFTQAERDVLKRLLAVRLHSYKTKYAHFFDEKYKRHYANYMGAVTNALAKVSQEEPFGLIKWEKTHCISVVNDEYRSLDEYSTLSDIVFDPEIRWGVIEKCS